MRARDKPRLGALRMIQAAIKQKEVDDRCELDDAGILRILGKMGKRHQDSIEQFTAAGRMDLAEKETAELRVVEEFMPERVSADEMEKQVQAVIEETGAQGMRDMGRVMGALQVRLQGQADMSELSGMVKARLSGN